MPRRMIPACLALTLAIGTAQAQVPYGDAAIPSRRALARVNLDLQWGGVVPLAGAEKLTSISIDAGMLFAQTNSANFYAFDGETGRQLWSANLGRVTTKSMPASVNSTTVFVTNSNRIFALDRRTGRQVWSHAMTDIASSSTSASEDYVMVGTESGKLETFHAKTGNTAWNIQTNARITSRPVIAGRVVAFGSEDRKLYLSRIDKPSLFWRFATGDKIVAPLGTHGTRTLLVPSLDKSLYAVDIFTGVGKWTYPTGSPVEQEPIVVEDDVYLVNNEGKLSAVDFNTGLSRWTISTLGGRLLAVSATKLYLESHDEDLFVVDRQTGKVVYDPNTTFSRAGINLRGYALGPTNRFDDRLYFGTTHGLIVCLRETSQVAPRPIRDPNARPFGYIPPEGYTDPTAPPPHNPPPPPPPPPPPEAPPPR
jgi:outer membrane protein assembly factor BamB